MIDIITSRLFYPMLFGTIGIIGVVLIFATCSTIKFLNGNNTHKGIVENIKDIFFKSSDNAKEVTIDTTSKMKDMHDNVVKVDFTSNHEHEFHTIECDLKQLKETVDDINEKVNDLMRRIIILEETKK